MTTKEQVLKCLISASGEFVSGAALSGQLGISRSAVWKAIGSLKKEGLSIDAVTNRGYRLGNENDILSAEAISACLTEHAEVFYYPSIDSTNNEAKRLIASGKGGTLLLVADEQTAGRGRQGKSFYSPALTGIYMTLVTHPMRELGSAVTVTTAAAVAVCRAIEALTALRPQIKWVNDVYLNGKKICGILTEAVSDFETGTVSSVIIGIGMNIKTLDFPKEIENAGSLGAEVRRAELIGAIADELLLLSKTDFTDFAEDYRKRSMIIGEKIEFIQNGSVTPATALAIDERGGLEVALKNGETKILRSGEISIRKQNS